MIRRLPILCLALLLASMGCASTSQVKRTDPVTILLANGDKIKADVLDIHNNKIIFKAEDWKKAYEYGEVINVERIKAIRLRDGQKLSLKEYGAYRKGERVENERRPVTRQRKRARSRPVADRDDFQYEELKNKPIAEMTENEFAFFMMMKEREISAAEQKAKQAEPEVAKKEQPPVEVIVIGSGHGDATVSSAETVLKAESVEVKRAPARKQTNRLFEPLPRELDLHPASDDVQARELVRSLIDANLATSYLSYLDNKSPLSPIESQMLNMIENDPGLQDQFDEVVFLNRAAKRVFERAFLYNPEDLSGKIGLDFDKDADLDYLGLMAQLHAKIGNNVEMGEFRLMVDVFGERGGRAIKGILENYGSWQFVMSRDNKFVIK